MSRSRHDNLCGSEPPREGAMSSTQIRQSHPATGPNAGTVDMKLEVVVIPVANVDRAKEFYTRLGWRLDADFTGSDGFRIVQLNPPGSACSIQFGTGLTSAVPGSAQGMYLVVPDIQSARNELVGCGVEIGEVFHEGALG